VSEGGADIAAYVTHVRRIRGQNARADIPRIDL